MTFCTLVYILKDCFVHMYILTIGEINRSLILKWIVNIVAMYHDIRLSLLFHFCTSCNSWQSDYIRLYRDAFHRIPLFWSYYESCILHLKQTSRKLCFGWNMSKMNINVIDFMIRFIWSIRYLVQLFIFRFIMQTRIIHGKVSNSLFQTHTTII